MIDKFKTYLEQGNMAGNTVAAYLTAVRGYFAHHEDVSRCNLLAHKVWLIDNFKPKTVNLHIQAINRYLNFVGHSEWRLKGVKVQQRLFLENVISNADYNFLKTALSREPRRESYFMVRFLAATGARVSELVQMKVEHVLAGHFDLYCKGGKVRRLYIPRLLRDEALGWMREQQRTTGYLFLNRYGERITARGIAFRLKTIALRYGLDPRVVYPHSFRHRYAKNFIERCGDIALLADLLGHESIETTRIYLRRTAGEQREVVDEVVNW